MNYMQLTNKLSVNKWAAEDQPRHKLYKLGAEALTNAELLSILIGSGSTEENAVQLSSRVLGDCGNNLITLGHRTPLELMEYNGLGFSKVMTILAAIELGRRRQRERPEERPDLGTATRIYNYMHGYMRDLEVEEFHALLMNQNYKLIKAVKISRGGLTETAVDIRIIMKECVMNNATILAVCHNHPSNAIRPSRMDDELTQSICKACNFMRIHFSDHVIITDGRYYSYHESGKI